MFKVGDKVKIIHSFNRLNLYYGIEGTIVKEFDVKRWNVLFANKDIIVINEKYLMLISSSLPKKRRIVGKKSLALTCRRCKNDCATCGIPFKSELPSQLQEIKELKIIKLRGVDMFVEGDTDLANKINEIIKVVNLLSNPKK